VMEPMSICACAVMCNSATASFYLLWRLCKLLLYSCEMRNEWCIMEAGIYRPRYCLQVQSSLWLKAPDILSVDIVHSTRLSLVIRVRNLRYNQTLSCDNDWLPERDSSTNGALQSAGQCWHWH
jgi:hypothetical protein